MPRIYADAQNESYEADVAVVGGGGSGLMTAYSLAQQGYHVVVLEAADILGGLLPVYTELLIVCSAGKQTCILGQFDPVQLVGKHAQLAESLVFHIGL